MEKLKHSKTAIISFIMVLINVIYVIIQTIIDIIMPIDIHAGINKSMAISYIIMSFMLAISIISFILGILRLHKMDIRRG